MKESLSFPSERSPLSHWVEVEVADAEEVPFQPLPLQSYSTAQAELVRQAPKRIHLALSKLKPFEVVHRQFQEWGITFSNAIALTPSNPAYPTLDGETLLMGAPNNGYIEAQFEPPVRTVTSRVTGSRRVVMAAFDEQNQPVACTETQGANLAIAQSSLKPNAPLSVTAGNIHRVKLYTFDGHLTLSDFAFSR